HSLHYAIRNEFLHGLSARAGGVKHEHFVSRVFEQTPRFGDAGRGDAEHGGSDGRTLAGFMAFGPARHPAPRARRVREDPAGPRTARSAFRSAPAAAATSARDTVGGNEGSPSTPASITVVANPADSIWSRRN